jgi:hypothetical protein
MTGTDEHATVTAWLEGEFVVFLIGVRLNRWWKPHRFLGVLRSAKRLLRGLEQDPDSGLMRCERWPGNPYLMVQYWRSWEHLERWAREPRGPHRETWIDFGKRVRASGDVGIWHETYRVTPGSYECVYTNMPPFGLGAIGERVPARGRFGRARNRFDPGPR